MFKRLISFLLIILVVTVSAAGCANGTSGGQQSSMPESSQPTPDVSDSQSESSQPTPDESDSQPESSQPSDDQPYPPKLDTGLPVIDFGGRDFRFYSRSQLPDSTINTLAPDIVADSLNSDILNNAVYERNMLLEDLYKIKFVNYQFDEPYKEVLLATKSDLDPCEVITDAIGDLAGLVVENGLYDLNSFSKYTRYTESWWDQNCRTQTTIKNKLFFMCGAITVMDNKATSVCAYNMLPFYISDFLECPCDLVHSGRWTYDTFHKMMKWGSFDLDENGNIDESDNWGLLTETSTYNVFAGSGAHIIKTNKYGTPYFSLSENEDNLTALKMSAEINGGRDYSISGPNSSDIDFREIFRDGRAMFFITTLDTVQSMRADEVVFGIVPLPKFDEEQQLYYSSIDPDYSCAYSVPSSVSLDDLEFVDLILENLAVYSQEMVEPVFIDQILTNSNGTRDKFSEPMLDIIFNNCIFDLGAIYNFGDMYKYCTSIKASRVDTFLAQLQTFKAGAEEDINTFIDFLDSNFK